MENGTLNYVNELRVVTVFFICVQGVDVSSDIGARMAQALMQSVQEACYTHEGQVNKFLVDDKGLLFLCVFGTPPMVHTDDPLRGILACFDIIQTFKKLGIEGNFGLSTGRVFCGVVGSSARMEYTTLGDSVNLAARLMQLGKANVVIVDETTYNQTRYDLSFDVLEPVKLKGKANLIPIFQPHLRVDHPTSSTSAVSPQVGSSRATSIASSRGGADRAGMASSGSRRPSKTFIDVSSMVANVTASGGRTSGESTTATTIAAPAAATATPVVIQHNIQTPSPLVTHEKRVLDDSDAVILTEPPPPPPMMEAAPKPPPSPRADQSPVLTPTSHNDSNSNEVPMRRSSVQLPWKHKSTVVQDIVSKSAAMAVAATSASHEKTAQLPAVQATTLPVPNNTDQAARPHTPSPGNTTPIVYSGVKKPASEDPLIDCETWPHIAETREIVDQSGILLTGGTIVFAGQSGLGKDQLCEYVLRRNRERHRQLAVVYATDQGRPKDRARPVVELLESCLSAAKSTPGLVVNDIEQNGSMANGRRDAGPGAQKLIELSQLITSNSPTSSLPLEGAFVNDDSGLMEVPSLDSFCTDDSIQDSEDDHAGGNPRIEAPAHQDSAYLGLLSDDDQQPPIPGKAAETQQDIQQEFQKGHHKTMFMRTVGRYGRRGSAALGNPDIELGSPIAEAVNKDTKANTTGDQGSSDPNTQAQQQQEETVITQNNVGAVLLKSIFSPIEGTGAMGSAGQLLLLPKHQQQSAHEDSDRHTGGHNQYLGIEHRYIDYCVKAVKAILSKRPVSIVMKISRGTSLFNVVSNPTFWRLFNVLSTLTQDKTLPNPLLLILLCRRTADGLAVAPFAKAIQLRQLPRECITEYIEKIFRLRSRRSNMTPTSRGDNSYNSTPGQSRRDPSVPDILIDFVCRLTEGNALYVTETLEQLCSRNLLTISDSGELLLAPHIVTADDLNKCVNISEWAHTSMVGRVICQLESLDPQASAIVKMATVFSGPFSVLDIAASLKSPWTNARC